MKVGIVRYDICENVMFLKFTHYTSQRHWPIILCLQLIVFLKKGTTCVKIGLISQASSISILSEMPSGPAALDVLGLDIRFWTPGVVTVFPAS